MNSALWIKQRHFERPVQRMRRLAERISGSELAQFRSHLSLTTIHSYCLTACRLYQVGLTLPRRERICPRIKVRDAGRSYRVCSCVGVCLIVSSPPRRHTQWKRDTERLALVSTTGRVGNRTVNDTCVYPTKGEFTRGSDRVSVR